MNFQFPNLASKNVQAEDVFEYLQHLCILHTNFKTIFRYVLSLETPSWIIKPHDEIKVPDVIL